MAMPTIRTAIDEQTNLTNISDIGVAQRDSGRRSQHRGLQRPNGLTIILLDDVDTHCGWLVRIGRVLVRPRTHVQNVLTQVPDAPCFDVDSLERKTVCHCAEGYCVTSVIEMHHIL
jgi:hypothetical protein